MGTAPLIKLVDSASGKELVISPEVASLAETLTVLLQNKSGTVALLDDLSAMNNTITGQIASAVQAATQSITEAYTQSIQTFTNLAPEDLNTFKEIADKFVLEDDAIQSILSALSEKVAATTFNALVTTVNGKLDGSHAGTGGDSHALATETVAGFMSSTDKTKVDGIQSGVKIGFGI